MVHSDVILQVFSILSGWIRILILLSPQVSLEHKGWATPASILKRDAGMLLALQFSSFTHQKLFLKRNKG